MLLQVDSTTLGMNLLLLIGALLLLGLSILIIGALFVGLRLWTMQRSERRSWAEYQKKRMGPDGKPFPPSMDGICQVCRRGDHKIYFLDSGEELCPGCYEAFCHQALVQAV